MHCGVISSYSEQNPFRSESNLLPRMLQGGPKTTRFITRTATFCRSCVYGSTILTHTSLRPSPRHQLPLLVSVWQRQWIYNTYTTPQASYRSCSSAFCVTDRAGVQPIGRRLSLPPQTLTYDETAIRNPGMPFYGLNPVVHLIIWITAYLPTPKEWKAELAWLVDP